MFLGYPKSGHSLVGSLLDAHPDAIIAHELHALEYVGDGIGKHPLFHLLLENSQKFTSAGREWTGYSYTVPNQWQGRFRELRVIGDKRGAGSVYALEAHPELLDRLRATVGVPVRFIHVIRHPLDNISTMFKQSRRGDMARSIDQYFRLAQTIAGLSLRIPPGDLFVVRHEEIIAAPEDRLQDLCALLGLEAVPEYLRDCASIVFKSARLTRVAAPWTPALLEEVRRRASSFPFFEGYDWTWRPDVSAADPRP